MNMRQWIEEEWPDDGLLFADGFDEAIIGVSYHWGGVTGGGCTRTNAVVYDLDKCIEILVERDGMTHEQARECLEFNTLGGYVGEHTPVFVEGPYWR